MNAELAIPQPQIRSRGPLLDFVRRLIREKPLGAAGGAIFLVFLFCGVFADFLAPYGIKLSERWLWNGVADPADPASFRFSTPRRAICV